MIAHVIERVRAMRDVFCVVGAVPATDDDLIEALRDLYVDTVMGSESDVLSRYVMGATMHQADIVLRITGDCPLWIPAAGDEVVRRMRDNPDLEYCSNDTRISGWPDGTEVEGFTRELLDRAAAADDVTLFDRAHVTPGIQRNAILCSTVHRVKDDTSMLKLSVDSLEDLRRVTTIQSRSRARDYSLASLAA